MFSAEAKKLKYGHWTQRATEIWKVCPKIQAEDKELVTRIACGLHADDLFQQLS